MNLHKHACLSPRGRALLVYRIIVQGLRVEMQPIAAGVSVRTAYKWLERFRQEGPNGLVDRSSRPCRCPHATSEAIAGLVVEKRVHAKPIARSPGNYPWRRAPSPRLLRRAGLHQLADLEPAAP